MSPVRKLARVALAVAALGVALLAVELVCRWTTPSIRSAELVEAGLREYDGVLGYRARPNARVHAVKKSDDQTIFDVEYSIDEHGRRATPLDGPQARPRFALFFGDSFTFGHGLRDDQTLPSRVGEFAREVRPYNYGLPGWGPQHALALLETRDLRAEIAEPSGIAVYTFIDAHVRRAVGSMSNVRWQSRNAPCYELDDAGVPRRLGTFASVRPWTVKAYSALGASSALQRMDFELPLLAGEHFDLVAAMLARCGELSREKLGASDFVVLIFPNATFGPQLVPRLAARRVHYLDYSTWDDPRAIERIPGDGHPTAAAYEAVAERLVLELGLP